MSSISTPSLTTVASCIRFDLASLWAEQAFLGDTLEQGLYRRWLCLTDDTGVHDGVQGYLRVSVLLLFQGQELGTSTPTSQRPPHTTIIVAQR